MLVVLCRWSEKTAHPAAAACWQPRSVTRWAGSTSSGRSGRVWSWRSQSWRRILRSTRAARTGCGCPNGGRSGCARSKTAIRPSWTCRRFPVAAPLPAREEHRGAGLNALVAVLSERGSGLRMVDELTGGAWGLRQWAVSVSRVVRSVADGEAPGGGGGCVPGGAPGGVSVGRSGVVLGCAHPPGPVRAGEGVASHPQREADCISAYDKHRDPVWRRPGPAGYARTAAGARSWFSASLRFVFLPYSSPVICPMRPCSRDG